jgi:ATP-binding cassette subfamily C protein
VKVPAWASVARLWSFARTVYGDSPGRAAGALTFLLLGSVTEGVSILLLIPLIHLIAPGSDVVTVPVPSSLQGLFGPALSLSLASVLVMLVVTVSVQALFDRFRTIHRAELLYDVVTRRRLLLFESIGRARWSFIAARRGSDLHHAVTADIDRIQAAAYYLLLLVQDSVLLLAYLTLSLVVSPTMTLFAFAMGLIMLAVLRPVRRRASRYGQLLTENRQQQYRTVSEFINGLKVAKSLNAEPRYLADLAGTLADMRDEFGRYLRVTTLGTALFQVGSVVLLSVFVFVAITVFHVALPELVVLVLLFWRTAPRFSALQTDLQELLVDLPAFDAVERLKAACDDARDDLQGATVAAPVLDGALRFRDVTFRYPEAEQTALQAASFTIPAKQVTALIGPSGSGKSTVADLVMGLLEPAEGTIDVDGVPLTPANRRAWRDGMAYVPQEAFLLHDTLGANLRLGLTQPVSDDEVWEALGTASADGFVRALSDGLDTIVGDRGLRLSGGERQRIALARALLRRPRVLVLDEATSALDWQSQTAIAAAVERLRGQATVVTIAHRVSMIAFADRVIALEDGEVVEEGQYTALLADPGSRLSRMVAAEGRLPAA